MTLNWPWWFLVLVVGVVNWPVVLGAAVPLLFVSVFMRGWVRWAALVAALPCLAVTGVAAWWALGDRQRDAQLAEFEARTHQTLEQYAVAGGLKLPAGTELRWSDVDHLHLQTASPPAPVLLFGVHVSWISWADDASGWDLQLAEPGTIDGWTCNLVGLRVSLDGKLRHCSLAAGRAWHGWPIPAGSLVDLTTPDKVGLVLPTGTSMAAPEIGHRITDTGGFAFNADGSLDNFYFDAQDPLLVAGRRLWNTVQWTYEPATYGQGRHRHAIAVRGSQVLDGNYGENIVIRLRDGKVTPGE